MPYLWRMRVQLLGYLAVGELSYLYVIFGSRQHSSLSRWIVGVYLQVLYLLVILVIVWWERLKKRRTRTQHAEEPLSTGVRLDDLEAWVRRSREERDRGSR
jgi:purine-cytosine permease-like protein